MKKSTKCVHSGTQVDPLTRGVNTPIYTSSAYQYEDREDFPYPRYFNTPNQQVIVDKICDLEGAEDGVVFSSGMAAISTSLFSFAGAGDHVVMMKELYGGTHSLAAGEFERLGIQYSKTETNADSILDGIKQNTKVVIIESPTNPMLGIVDIQRVAQGAKEAGAITIIDNTFATPINQNPIVLGIDIVVHSGTKYFGGHSDLCCGVAVTNKENAKRIRTLAKNLGGSLNAQACYLLERSLKTLGLRVQRQTDNAMKIAEFLQRQSRIHKVFYPGLSSNGGHQIAKTQMDGFGAIVAFEVAGSIQEAKAFSKSLTLIETAASLGGVESTICSPAETSHVAMSAAGRAEVGITDNTFRLSVGIEDVDDLIGDLNRSVGSLGSLDSSKSMQVVS